MTGNFKINSYNIWANFTTRNYMVLFDYCCQYGRQHFWWNKIQKSAIIITQSCYFGYTYINI
jgi:hypothetical protein